MSPDAHASLHLTLAALQSATLAAARIVMEDDGAVEWVRRHPEMFGQLVLREINRKEG